MRIQALNSSDVDAVACALVHLPGLPRGIDVEFFAQRHSCCAIDRVFNLFRRVSACAQSTKVCVVEYGQTMFASLNGKFEWFNCMVCRTDAKRVSNANPQRVPSHAHASCIVRTRVLHNVIRSTLVQMPLISHEGQGSKMPPSEEPPPIHASRCHDHCRHNRQQPCRFCIRLKERA